MAKQKIVTGSAGAFLRPAVWSNLFFLFPLFLALKYGDIYVAIAIGLLFISSMAYHALSEGEDGALLWNDRFFASILTLFSAGLVVFGGFTFPYGYIAIALVFPALYLHRKQGLEWDDNDIQGYEYHHAVWHLLTSLITVFSILTFYA